MNPPLLLLPGMLADAAFWSAQVEELADVCDPLVIDYGLADRIEHMALIVLARAPKRFALAGHSMGGRVAQEVVRRAPERVTKLALMCTDYRGPAQDASDWEDLAEIARTGGMRNAGKAWLKHLLAPERLGDGKLVSDIIEMVARQSPEHLAAHIRAGRTRPDYSDLLPAIRCPTLVCAGAEDSIRPVAVHEDMASRIPGSSLSIIPRAGHMVAMERPEHVTLAMRAWLLGNQVPAAELHRG